MQVHPACALFPEMDAETYEQLKASIREQGLLEPITIWNGHIIDGRHRERACRELGIEPRYEEFPGSEAEVIDFILAKNATRRHLTPSQKAMVLVSLLAMRQRVRAQEKAEKTRRQNLQATQAKVEALQQRRVPDPPQGLEGMETSSSFMAPMLAPSDKQNLEGRPPGSRRRRADAREEVARQYRINHTYLSQAKALYEKDPTLADLVRAGRLTLPRARPLLASVPDGPRAKVVELLQSGSVPSVQEAIRQVKAERSQSSSSGAAPGCPSYRLETADLHQAVSRLEPASVDLVLTELAGGDVPAQWCEDLARAAVVWLKEGASCIVLADPGLLPQVFEWMLPHLRYHWMLACRTPANTARAAEKGVLGRWRPALWFVKGHYAGDAVPDWLASSRPEEALAELVRRLTPPGGLVVDPLVGDGMTAIATARAGRRFVGFGADEGALERVRARLDELGLLAAPLPPSPPPGCDELLVEPGDGLDAVGPGDGLAAKPRGGDGASSSPTAPVAQQHALHEEPASIAYVGVPVGEPSEATAANGGDEKVCGETFFDEEWLSSLQLADPDWTPDDGTRENMAPISNR